MPVPLTCPSPPVVCLLPSPLSQGFVSCVTQGSGLSLEGPVGQTLLHMAAQRGHAGVVALLLQRGVDVNARDEDGLSPLLLAVKGRYLGSWVLDEDTHLL